MCILYKKMAYSESCLCYACKFCVVYGLSSDMSLWLVVYDDIFRPFAVNSHFCLFTYEMQCVYSLNECFSVCKVEYFNNYLRDPQRPQLPEHPTSKPSTGSHPAPAREHPYAPPISFHGPLPPPPPVSYRPAPYAGEALVSLHIVLSAQVPFTFHTHGFYSPKTGIDCGWFASYWPR